MTTGAANPTSEVLDRHARSDRTRAAILRAAGPIFAEKGLAGARTDEIATAAHVNKALLYYYFKSKDDLYYEVLEERLGEFAQRAEAVFSQELNVRGTLLAFVSAHFDYLSDLPYYSQLFQQVLMAGGKGLERVTRRFSLPMSQRLGHLIERGIRNGELRRVDPGQTVASIIGLTVHYFIASPMIRLVAEVDPYDKKLLERRRQEILDFVRYGLFKNPEEPWA